MKTKVYQRPTMKVVQLQHHTHLLQTSVQDRQSSVQNYTTHDYVEE